MLIENMIADAVDFFHMDALSAAVPLRIDLDVQLTLMASALYRCLANRPGERFRSAEPASLFRKLVQAPPRWRSAPSALRSRSVAAPTIRTCSQPATATP